MRTFLSASAIFSSFYSNGIYYEPECKNDLGRWLTNFLSSKFCVYNAGLRIRSIFDRIRILLVEDFPSNHVGSCGEWRMSRSGPVRPRSAQAICSSLGLVAAFLVIWIRKIRIQNPDPDPTYKQSCENFSSSVFFI